MSNEYTFFEKIFSIKHEVSINNVFKVVTIFGIHIKIRDKKRAQIEFVKQFAIVSSNYQKNLERISHKEGKIKVGFIINENQKWNCQSLYDELEASDRFEPVILITPLLVIHEGESIYRSDILENEEFFRNKNMPTIRAYNIEKKEYIPIKNFGIDILFYEQPWQIFEGQHIFETSKTMLTCYIPYCFHMLEVPNNYFPHFHKYLWTYFVEADLYKDNYKKQYNAKNCVALGHTKMDNYFLYPKEKAEKKTIIYAPHHFETVRYKFITFDWNGKELLSFAKNHPEFDWVFKPHPVLKSSLILKNVMTEAEVDDYFAQWAEVGTLHTQGDYFHLFNKSSCLITDCISFLAEYMPTENPVLFLKTKNQIAPFTELGEKITSHYYKIYNWQEFEKTFDDVIINSNDYLREERLEDLKCLNLDKSKTVAKKVIEYLEDQLFTKISN